ncbi:hypothetical protein DAI22_03g251501 [Oryza sativa Japonica Group]|nr:hypothetical protein DAI22_03g251501 [Oryza sativa Japonica Group]
MLVFRTPLWFKVVLGTTRTATTWSRCTGC